MTRPRTELACTEDTPYYHIVSRCVRRSFLCGIDSSNGKSYAHRRQWIENRMRILASLFAIEICSYAVMSNHYHIILKLCPDDVEQWTDAEVLERGTSLYKGSLLIQKFNLNEAIHQQIEQQCLRHFDLPLKPLACFEGGITQQQQKGILLGIKDYIELVDYTGRLIHPNKRGAIPAYLPPILQRLNLNHKQWLENSTQFERVFYRRFGSRRKHLANTG